MRLYRDINGIDRISWHVGIRIFDYESRSITTREMMTMIKKKRGVKVKGLKAPMIWALKVAHKLMAMAHQDIVITSAVRPAVKGQKSLHPDGLAVDIRTRDLSDIQRAALFSALTEILGNDYDVIQYDTHVHIEYQRAIDDNKVIDLQKTFGVDDFQEVA